MLSQSSIMNQILSLHLFNIYSSLFEWITCGKERENKLSQAIPLDVTLPQRKKEKKWNDKSHIQKMRNEYFSFFFFSFLISIKS